MYGRAYRIFLSRGRSTPAMRAMASYPCRCLCLGLRLQMTRMTPRRLITLRSEEHTSELQSQSNLVCRLLLEKKNITTVAAAAMLGAAVLIGHRFVLGDLSRQFDFTRTPAGRAAARATDAVPDGVSVAATEIL